MNKIYKKGENLIIEIPLTTTRSNPYDENFSEPMDNIMGLIIHHDNGFDECGFVYKIDMSYAGKEDQWTDFFYKEFEGCEEFKKLLKQLEIPYMEYNE